MSARRFFPHSEQCEGFGQCRPRPIPAGAALLVAVLLGGCQTAPSTPTVVAAPAAPIAPGDQAAAPDPAFCGIPEAAGGRPGPVAPASRTDAAASDNDDLWSRLRAGFRLWGENNPRIDREIARLQRSPVAFQALLARAEPYLHHLSEAVTARGLPTELVLLPAVESGYQPYAHSPHGAAGLWQIIPSTGKMLGLRQDWWYDGRRDLDAATTAALQHLQDLVDMFDGDWLHALAAYNAGPGTVRRALRKARRSGAPETFWDLDLPGETDNYAPRLLALARIVADPARYGLQLPDVDDAQRLASVDAGSQIDLKVAAELAGLPVEDLLLLNPGFNRWSTPPQGPHRLLLPSVAATALRVGLATLPAEDRVRWTRYKVRKGDVLGRIARKFSTSVTAIREANRLRGTRIRAGSHLVIPLSSEPISADASLAGRIDLPRSRLRYRVRKGDSLYKIARRFQVRVADLRRWNDVGTYIRPGDRLTVLVDPARQTL